MGLAKVERQHKQLEIQTEAARLAAECTLNVKLTKADEKRQENLEEMMKRLKEHEEYVAKVRESHERLFSEDKTKVEAELARKLENAAKKREMQEKELMSEMDEKNKHA